MTLLSKPALLLVDIQKGLEDLEYYGGHRNNPDAEKNSARLLHFWRQHRLPVFHIKHNSIHPPSPLAKGKPGNDFKDIVRPLDDEVIIEKEVNSAFINTDLKQQLENADINSLVVVGLTTDHCVSSTARMAGNFGFNTFVVADATATFDKIGADGKKYAAEILHEAALASLHQEFATVLKTAAVLNQFTRS